MFTKRLLLLALVAALVGTAAGCCWRHSSCRHACEPDCRNYDPCR